MIQNYNRVDALPPLVDNRYYNRNHLVYLYYINILKADFSLKQIKEALDRSNTDNNMLEVHSELLELEQYSIQNIPNNNLSMLLKMLEIVKLKNSIFL